MRGRGQERGVEKKMKSVLCNILKVTPHHFSFVLFLKSKLLGPTHSQGKGIT